MRSATKSPNSPPVPPTTSGLWRRTSAARATAPTRPSTPRARRRSRPPPTSGVTQTGATLEAKVRPAFSPTTYHFEYGTGTSYGATTPEGPSIGADNVAARREPGDQRPQSPGTTYHFRVVASNGVGTTAGPDQTFKTEAAAVPPPQPSPPVKCKRGFVKTAREVRAEEEAAPQQPPPKQEPWQWLTAGGETE